jgi:predicted DNA-binding protein
MGKASTFPWKDRESIRSLLQDEVDTIQGAIETRDVDQLLRLVRGKGLLKVLARNLGRSSADILVAAREHPIDGHEHLVALREDIVRRLQVPSEGASVEELRTTK